MPSITITFGDMTPVDRFEDSEDGKSCPLPTQDPNLNDTNKESAMETSGYRNPENDGGFRADELCANCGAYNQTEDMLDCIGDSSETLGYCQLLKFVCSSDHTCDKWVTGGPITGDMDEDYNEIL